MADTFDFTDDSKKEETVNLNSVEQLKGILYNMSLSTDVTQRSRDVLVRVQSSVGSSEYLARMEGDLHWLKSVSHKREARGSFRLFYIKIEGQEVPLP